MNWWDMLSHHQTVDTYMSLLYAYPLRYVLDHYRIVQLITIGTVIVLFFLNRHRWKDFAFRATDEFHVGDVLNTFVKRDILKFTLQWPMPF